MSDPNPTPTPTPAPTPQTSPRAQWPINKKYITELDLAEHICAAAQRAPYVQPLAAEDVDATAVQNLTDKITAAEDLIFQATGGKAGRKILTQTEQGFRDTLLAQVQAIQKRAKRKYTSSDDPNRDKYFLHHSHNLEGNHAMLLTAADSIAKTLPTDKLPGVKATTATDLQKAADDFRGGLQAQSGGGGDTGKAFKALDAAIAEIATLRRDFQLAADTIWPAGIPANAPIRAEFKLPPDRSLK
jgi:hypothetical protein